MSSSNLIRWGGLAVLLGGVLWGLHEVGWYFFVTDQHQHPYPQPQATIFWVIFLMANLFVLLGLPALYARQAEQAGTLGLIALVVVFFGMALSTGLAWFGAFIQPGLHELQGLAEGAGVTMQEPILAGVGFVVSLMLHVLGWILFGLASLRAGVLPRWAVVLAMVGPLFWLLSEATGFSLPLPVFAIGLAWLGFALWREKGKVLAEPATAM
jgi:hypothetical protein